MDRGVTEAKQQAEGPNRTTPVTREETTRRNTGGTGVCFVTLLVNADLVLKFICSIITNMSYNGRWRGL